MFAASKTASVSGGYQISRSLRFNSADSAYLARTPASATNRQTWTWSGWVKRTALGAYSTIFGHCSSDGLQQHTAWFRNDDTLQFYIYSSGYNLNLITTQVFRDVSAWYHIVIAQDTTQATDTNRAKIYVNGVQVTAFSTAAYPTQNTNGFINSNVAHGIGSFPPALGSYFDGYQTEINLVDGQALTPSSFGQSDAQTGVWQPIAYSGSYGTNGFYLKFSDNSNNTAATLGADYSGNGNNWTPYNFSVTAGSGNDSLVDSPTSYGVDNGVGGNVRGNYCTMNPIANPSTPTYSITNGNLDYATTGGSGNAAKQAAIATIGVITGKWYYEGTVTSNNPGLGFSSELFFNSQRGTIRITYFSGSLANSAGITATGSPATFTNGDVIAVAYDADAGTATVYKNNASQGTFSGIATGTALFPYVEPNTADSGSGVSFNFGQRPFAYTAPSGFKALCTQNLTTPTIGATTATQANKYFDTVLRTGAGGGTYSTTVNMANGALLWDKPRNQASSNYLVDSVRGISNHLRSNQTGPEVADTSWFTAFNNGSYTTGASDWGSPTTIVDWIWAAGSGTSNTTGSITSTVGASATSGFSIVTYTGTGLAGTIGHGLGVAPSMIIVKSKSATGDWPVYTAAIGNSSNLLLNSTAATASSSTIWNATSPTSSVFSVGINTDSNTVTVTYVAYCFAEVAGYSKIGSYTGNGSADGPFVFTNMRPAFLMIKRTDTTSNWTVLDFKRLGYNVDNNQLFPNLVDSEVTTDLADLLSNGVKLRSTDASINASGGTYIFMALAESPFKYSLAR
jgi:hypothetical protein